MSFGGGAHIRRGLGKGFQAPSSALYARLTGASGAYVSTPDSAGVSITGAIDIRVLASLTNWGTGSAQVLVGKWQSSGAGVSYSFRSSASGFPALLLSADGTATSFNQTGNVAIPYAAGAAGWLRVTAAPSGGNYTAQFSSSADGVTWTQFGSDRTAALAGIYDGTSIVELGSQAGGTNSIATGRIYYVEIRNGINGTVVARFRPSETQAGRTSFTSSTGEPWTINGAASLR